MLPKSAAARHGALSVPLGPDPRRLLAGRGSWPHESTRWVASDNMRPPSQRPRPRTYRGGSVAAGAARRQAARGLCCSMISSSYTRRICHCPLFAPQSKLRSRPSPCRRCGARPTCCVPHLWHRCAPTAHCCRSAPLPAKWARLPTLPCPAGLFTAHCAASPTVAASAGCAAVV